MIYHQIYLDVDSQALAAFIARWDLYKSVTPLLESTNAPIEFKQFLENYPLDFRFKLRFPHLDDIIVFSPVFSVFSSRL